MQWMYVTQLDVPACMARLFDPDIGSVDELNPYRVQITRISDFQLHLVCKGRRFSKERKTEYLVSILHDDASSGASITVEFKRELFNIPSPMTPITELDTFLKLALNASRVS